MIVRSAGNRIQLITQPDHAQLAGRVMSHCVSLGNHPRRRAILHAIAEHDNGWAEEDAEPRVDPRSGAVVDFVNAPLAVRHAVWPRGVARLGGEPWAAALVAQHAITVYDRFRPEPEWKEFFAGMKDARDEMLRAGGLRLVELLADYAFVRLGDLISLTFCTGWTDAQHFGGWTVHLADPRVTVTPDPFGGAVIPIEIEAREIASEPFSSDAQLRDALADAPTTTLTGAVAP